MKFTVLMPTYDKVKLYLLKKSINSVIFSSIKPDEFLILVDGKISNNKKNFLLKIEKKYKFIKIIFKKKIGLVKILNFGINKAKFNIIARADSDDINHPLRFKKQINFFIKNKIDILGGNILEIIGKKKRTKKVSNIPTFIEFLFYNPINHMTVMFNKKKILKLGGYPNIAYKEDYALWLKAKFSNYKIMNLNDTLVKCYLDNEFFSRRKNINSIFSEILIFKLIISKNFLLLPLSILSFLLRIFFLLLPNPIYLLIKNIFHKR